jgi:hypothetical protein
MPDTKITVSPAVMGLIAPSRTGPRHSVIVPPRRQRGSRLPADTVVEGGHRGSPRWRRAGMNSRLNRMDWGSVESMTE